MCGSSCVLVPNNTMLKKLAKIKDIDTILMVFGMIAFCFLLNAFRIFYTSSLTFGFLNWNLFLAFVPWVLSVVWLAMPSLHANRMAVFSLFGLWLLFFPNAPYILTDLFHLRLDTRMPKWYDLVMILSYAWTGLFMGFLSLKNIEEITLRKFSKRNTVLMIVFLLFLASYGVYVGRFLRWNSWDMLQNPLHLLNTTWVHVRAPFEHTRTWGVTITLGVLLNMMYFSLKCMRPGKN